MFRVQHWKIPSSPSTFKLYDVVIYRAFFSTFYFSMQIFLLYIQIILNEFSDTHGSWVMTILFSILY